MSRSGYSSDPEYVWEHTMWRGAVRRAIRGRRGQSFLVELAGHLDDMPIKELIADQLEDADGRCCTLGVILKARGVEIDDLDYEDSKDVGEAAGIAWSMAAEIAYVNDELGGYLETPEHRWTRVREWMELKLLKNDRIFDGWTLQDGTLITDLLEKRNERRND